MKCPKCGKTLEAHINKYQDKDTDYIEVEVRCESDVFQHCYFVRMKEDDLMEC